MTTIQTSNINKDSYTAPRVVKRELPFKGSENNTSQNTSQPQRRKKSNNGAKAFFGLLLLAGGGFVFKDHLAKFAESVGLIKKAVKPEGEVAKAAENAASGGSSVISDIKDKFVNWFKRSRKTEVKKTEAPKASPKPAKEAKTPAKKGVFARIFGGKGKQKAVKTAVEEARIEVPVTRTEIEPPVNPDETIDQHIDLIIDDNTRLPGENSSISRKLNEIWGDQPVESAKTSVWQDFKEFIGIKEKTPDKVMAGKSTKIDSQPLETSLAEQRKHLDIIQSDAEIEIASASDMERSKNVSKGKSQPITKSEPEENLLDKALKLVGLDKKSQRLKTAKKELAAIDANIAKTEAKEASPLKKDLVAKKQRADGIKVEETPQQVPDSLGQIAENGSLQAAGHDVNIHPAIEEVNKTPKSPAEKALNGFGEINGKISPEPSLEPEILHKPKEIKPTSFKKYDKGNITEQGVRVAKTEVPGTFENGEEFRNIQHTEDNKLQHYNYLDKETGATASIGYDNGLVKNIGINTDGTTNWKKPSLEDLVNSISHDNGLTKEQQGLLERIVGKRTDEAYPLSDEQIQLLDKYLSENAQNLAHKVQRYGQNRNSELAASQYFIQKGTSFEQIKAKGLKAYADSGTEEILKEAEKISAEMENVPPEIKIPQEELDALDKAQNVATAKEIPAEMPVPVSKPSAPIEASAQKPAPTAAAVPQPKENWLTKLLGSGKKAEKPAGNVAKDVPAEQIAGNFVEKPAPEPETSVWQKFIDMHHQRIQSEPIRVSSVAEAVPVPTKIPEVQEVVQKQIQKVRKQIQEENLPQKLDELLKQNAIDNAQKQAQEIPAKTIPETPAPVTKPSAPAEVTAPATQPVAQKSWVETAKEGIAGFFGGNKKAPVQSQNVEQNIRITAENVAKDVPAEEVKVVPVNPVQPEIPAQPVEQIAEGAATGKVTKEVIITGPKFKVSAADLNDPSPIIPGLPRGTKLEPSIPTQSTQQVAAEVGDVNKTIKDAKIPQGESAKTKVNNPKARLADMIEDDKLFEKSEQIRNRKSEGEPFVKVKTEVAEKITEEPKVYDLDTILKQYNKTGTFSPEEIDALSKANPSLSPQRFKVVGESKLADVVEKPVVVKPKPLLATPPEVEAFNHNPVPAAKQKPRFSYSRDRIVQPTRWEKIKGIISGTPATEHVESDTAYFYPSQNILVTDFYKYKKTSLLESLKARITGTPVEQDYTDIEIKLFPPAAAQSKENFLTEGEVEKIDNTINEALNQAQDAKISQKELDDLAKAQDVVTAKEIPAETPVSTAAPQPVTAATASQHKENWLTKLGKKFGIIKETTQPLEQTVQTAATNIQPQPVVNIVPSVVQSAPETEEAFNPSIKNLLNAMDNWKEKFGFKPEIRDNVKVYTHIPKDSDDALHSLIKKDLNNPNNPYYYDAIHNNDNPGLIRKRHKSYYDYS